MSASGRTQAGRRRVTGYDVWTGRPDGAAPVRAASGHAIGVTGSVLNPQTLGGLLRNPSPGAGAFYRYWISPTPVSALFCRYRFIAGASAAGAGIALLINPETGDPLHDILHLDWSPTAWALSYVIGQLSGPNPLIAVASGPLVHVAGQDYNMGMVQVGTTVGIFLPDNTFTAVTNANLGVVGGRRAAHELAWTAGNMEPRFVSVQSSETSQTLTPLTPQDETVAIGKVMASHESTVAANVGNLIARQGDATTEVEIGRSTAFGIPSIRLGPGGPELYRNGVFLGSIAPHLIAQGSADQAIIGQGLAFFNAAAQVKQTVTGSRGGNAALASLLTALANYGLITDSTTA